MARGKYSQSIKHVVDSEGALSGATNSTNVIANAVNAYADPRNPTEVLTGSTVNAFFLSIFIIGATGSGNTGSINWYIAKRREGQISPDVFPNAGATGVSNVRNQIFHEEKGLSGSIDGTPMAFKGVVVVPRGMRRMREGDDFVVRLRGTDGVTDYNFCVKAIYKSFA